MCVCPQILELLNYSGERVFQETVSRIINSERLIHRLAFSACDAGNQSGIERRPRRVQLALFGHVQELMGQVVVHPLLCFRVHLGHVGSYFQISVHRTDVQDGFTFVHFDNASVHVVLPSVHDLVIAIGCDFDWPRSFLRVRLSVRNLVVFFDSLGLSVRRLDGGSCGGLSVRRISDILMLGLGFGASCAHRGADLLLAARLLDGPQKARVTCVERAVVERLGFASALVRSDHHLRSLAA